MAKRILLFAVILSALFGCEQPEQIAHAQTVRAVAPALSPERSPSMAGP